MASIEEDTPIMPGIVAETIIEQVQAHVGEILPDNYAGDLAQRAEKIYSTNDTFKQAIRAPGNKGRDTIYAFMRHWLAGILHKDQPAIYAKLWHGFANGSAPPCRNN